MKKNEITNSDDKSNKNTSVEHTESIDENTCGSNISESGLLCVDTDSVQNITSPLNSNNSCEDEDNSHKNTRESKTSSDKEVLPLNAVLSNHLNLVVYTDPDICVDRQYMRETNEENLCNSTGVKPEVTNKLLQSRYSV